MMVDPKPRRLGAVTAGPPCSQPVDHQIALVILLPAHRDGAVVRQRAIFGGVGGQFVEHQRQAGEGGGLQQQIGAFQGDALALLAQIGAGLGLQKIHQPRRAPAIGGDQVMGARHRLDAVIERGDEVLRAYAALPRDCEIRPRIRARMLRTR